MCPGLSEKLLRITTRLSSIVMLQSNALNSVGLILLFYDSTVISSTLAEYYNILPYIERVKGYSRQCSRQSPKCFIVVGRRFFSFKSRGFSNIQQKVIICYVTAI